MRQQSELLPYVGAARFSDCRNYRYTLRRTWDYTKKSVCFAMLNPSTATEDTDDPTIRRCIGYAKKWGYGSLIVVNIFAFRATDPQVMFAAAKSGFDVIGPENNKSIADSARECYMTVCAWGNHGSFMGRSRDVLQRLRNNHVEPYALRISKTGEPGHPLYLAYDLKPEKMKI